MNVTHFFPVSQMTGLDGWAHSVWLWHTSQDPSLATLMNIDVANKAHRIIARCSIFDADLPNKSEAQQVMRESTTTLDHHGRLKHHTSSSIVITSVNCLTSNICITFSKITVVWGGNTYKKDITMIKTSSHTKFWCSNDAMMQMASWRRDDTSE